MFKYIAKRFILNSNEYKFYKFLDSFIDSKYSIVPQVHLDDLVKPNRGLSVKGRLYSLRHINQKSVDFVIFDKHTMRALLAIELDGSSHVTETAIKNDEEKNRILKDAGIVLKRFKDSESLDTLEIEETIKKALNI